MRNLTKLLILPALLAGALAAGSALAHDPGMDCHGMHRMAIRHALEQLDLSDSQKASVKQMFQTGHAAAKPQFEALLAARQAFESATPGTPDYQTAAANLASAESAAATAHAQQEAGIRAQIYALLSDQQKATFAKLQAERAAHMADWKAKHEMEPPPME